MNLKVTTKVRCPHCGKKLTVNLDLTTPEETWLEDCQLCKQSIHFSSLLRDGSFKITAEQPD
jgi:transcription elongation factor Elf1